MNWLDAPLLRALRDARAMAGFTAREWDLLARQANGAGLLGRLHAQAGALGLEETVIPAAVRRQMTAVTTGVRLQTRAVYWEVKQIAQVLAPTGAPVLLLKGAAYAAAGLPAALGRLFSDVDILVPKTHLADVEQALLAAGWAGATLDAYDQRYYRRWMHELPPMMHVGRRTPLDVHHNILPETARLRTCPDRIIAAATPLTSQLRIFVPCSTDQVLHSATHLFHEGDWGHGLRDLSDLDLLLRAYGAVDDFWPQLAARATELNLRQPLTYALRYARRVLLTPVPQALLGEPGPEAMPLMDFLFMNGLAAAHHSLRTRWTASAQGLLYVRSHWLRMPLHLLVPHLLHKTLPRMQQGAAL